MTAPRLLACRICGDTTGTCRNMKKVCLCGARYNQPCIPNRDHIHDRPASYDQPHRRGRDPIPGGRVWPYRAMLAMRKDGITERRIAHWFGVSPRRIQKVLYEARHAVKNGEV